MRSSSIDNSCNGVIKAEKDVDLGKRSKDRSQTHKCAEETPNHLVSTFCSISISSLAPKSTKIDLEQVDIRATETCPSSYETHLKRQLCIQTDLTYSPSSCSVHVNALKTAYKMNKLGVNLYCGGSSTGNSEKGLHFLREAMNWFEIAINAPEGMDISSTFLSKSHSSLICQVASQVSATSYIYQRVDFDEGMFCYTNLVHLHKEPKSYTFFPNYEPASKCQQNFLYCNCMTRKSYVVSVGATIMYNLGQAYDRAHDSKHAQALYQSALDTLKSFQPITTETSLMIEGDDQSCCHPLTIPILHKIGQIRYKCGDISSSITTYLTALSTLNKLSGCDYELDLAHTLNALGVLKYHEAQCDSGAALNYLQTALSIYKSVLGEHHPSVATTLNNIGRIYVHKDDFATALEFYDEALQIRKQKIGKDSLDYAATAFNAAQSLHQLGDLEHALCLYREFLRVAEKTFTVNHRDVAVVLSGMGQIYQERGEFDLAETFFIQSIEAGRASLGKFHSEVAMMLNRIGNFYFERKRLDKAIQYYSEGLEVEVKCFDILHPNILVTLSNLGEIYRQRKEWRKAIDLYLQILEIEQTRFGNNLCDEIASTLNTLGMIYDQKGDEANATRYLQEALSIRKTLLGDVHAEVANTLSSLGSIYYKSNSLTKAMNLFQECLSIRRRLSGPDHQDVALVLYNIALVHQQRGMISDAIEHFGEALLIEISVLGEDHRDVAITLFKLGEVYRSNDDMDRAIYYFQRSLNIHRSLGIESSDAVSIARALNEIGNIHLIRGNIREMMASFNEAARVFRQAGLSPENLSISWHHSFDRGEIRLDAAPAA